MKLIQTNKELTGYQVWPKVTSRLWEAQEKYSVVFLLGKVNDAARNLNVIIHNKLVELYSANIISAEDVGGPVGYIGCFGPKGLPGNIDLKDPNQHYKYIANELLSTLESYKDLSRKLKFLFETLESK